jgi:hypothetical protein
MNPSERPPDADAFGVTQGKSMNERVEVGRIADSLAILVEHVEAGNTYELVKEDKDRVPYVAAVIMPMAEYLAMVDRVAL